MNPENNRQDTNSKSFGPGVRFPPPLVYLLAILIGIAIDRFVPIRVLPASLIGWLGGALVMLFVIITVLSFRELIKSRTTFRADRTVSAVLTTGPYRYSRNPLYIALSILQLGVGIWMNNVWVVMLLVPTIAWIRWRVIASEERYLIVKFGQAYLDYQAKVRRWL
jgi:protein-S-isoprenylcysteine O-methyltransferase Ste14